jgi:putative membrane protein
VTGEPVRLSEEARANIAAAIGRAEARTSAEIVVMVSARAARYRKVALLVALLAGLALPWALLWLTALSTAAILLAQAGTVLAILLLMLHEGLRLAFVPRSLRRGRAADAARLAFWSRGLTRTRGRTGVLIYLAAAERHAEIVADAGVLARVGPEPWTAVVADLTEALRRGEDEAGLVRAVEALGTILAGVLPAGAANPDELPNRVIIEAD